MRTTLLCLLLFVTVAAAHGREPVVAEVPPVSPYTYQNDGTPGLVFRCQFKTKFMRSLTASELQSGDVMARTDYKMRAPVGWQATYGRILNNRTAWISAADNNYSHFTIADVRNDRTYIAEFLLRPIDAEASSREEVEMMIRYSDLFVPVEIP